MNSPGILVELLVWPLFWLCVGLCAAVGLLSLARPKLLAAANAKSGRWIDSQKLFEFLDRQIHIDHFVLRHNRVFGGLSLLTAVSLTVWYFIG